MSESRADGPSCSQEARALQPSMAFYCYVLECSDGTYYTGWTTEPARRLRQHNHGRGARYTRSRLPVRMVYLEECPDRATAMKRERANKALSRSQKEKLIS
jgi:putative endonuclease